MTAEGGASTSTTTSTSTTATDTTTGEGANPLLEDWTGPFGGVPPFDRVRVEHFAPAIDAAVAATLEEVERIADDPSPPDFGNTLTPFERAGRLLARVNAVGGVWRTALSTPAFQAIEAELMAKLAALSDRIRQNGALFERIEAVYQTMDQSGLTPEQRRVVWNHHTDFVRAGAGLHDDAKRRLAEINQRLATLSTHFGQHVLADEDEVHVVLGDAHDVEGLPEPDRRAAREAAERKGHPGKWLIENNRSTVESFLTYHPDRNLRRVAYEGFVRRGATPERDNGPVVAEVLRLRAERASLLGHPSHAHWALEKTMARTPDRALQLSEDVWRRAFARARVELEGMGEAALADGVEKIEPWDYRYYAEKRNGQRLGVDWREVEDYLELGRLRDGMFWVAGELFGLEFTPTELPVYHPDVRAWRVSDRPTGRHVGLFYFDPFARPGKKSGAWMSHYQRQEALDAPTPPIVSNNCNFPRPPQGEPALISWTDAITLFHEFGHALHGLLSGVTYGSVAGTQVSADYVELPSQLLESWLSTPEVLHRFALHHRTGEPLPAELVGKMNQAVREREIFHLCEQLLSTLIDLRIHLAGADGAADPARFERETLAAYRADAPLPPRHWLPHFAHLFSGDQYAAKYYSYLWADVLAADARDAFLEGGGMFDPEVARRLREEVLSRGNAVEPDEGYRAFRGRDPNGEALMRDKGLLD